MYPNSKETSLIKGWKGEREKRNKFYDHLNDKNRFPQKKKNEIGIRCLPQNTMFQKTLASYYRVLRGKILWQVFLTIQIISNG